MQYILCIAIFLSLPTYAYAATACDRAMDAVYNATHLTGLRESGEPIPPPASESELIETDAA